MYKEIEKKEVIIENKCPSKVMEDKALKQIWKRLKREYPSYHWKHIKVWSAFWNFVDVLDR